MYAINIFQKEWAFTSKDSVTPIIETGAFGPCYVVTFTSGDYAAMVHIDDTTKVDSVQDIFNKFLEFSVELKSIKVTILGGWKDHIESYKWGYKLLTKIQDAGFENVICDIFTKAIINKSQQVNGVDPDEVINHYHLGAAVDARYGNTALMDELNMELNNEQLKKNIAFVEKYGTAQNIELPITEVL